jgi:Leucine-rich repeat (LRR) protein
MTGAASGREIECDYERLITALWPSHKSCRADSVDYSAKFETEKHSFSGNSSEKLEAKTFRINNSLQVDFIPLDILTEFPNLNGLAINGCNLPTVKAGLFRVELNKIEFLCLQDNKIELVQAKAFEHLTKLKWVRLGHNNLQTLPYQLFRNNPDLIFIGLFGNQINSIHLSFFDGLNSLKFIVFEENLCINEAIGCETCSVSQTDLKNPLQKCFDNCAPDTICEFLYLTHKTPKSVENEVASLSAKMETELELGRNATKQAIETNNQKIQEAIDSKLKNMENHFKDFLKQEYAEIIQQKFDELEKKFMASN